MPTTTYSTTEVDDLIAKAIGGIQFPVLPDFTTFVLKSDLPTVDLSDYVTIRYVEEAIANGAPTGTPNETAVLYGLWLDTFTGTDDEKLDKAIAASGPVGSVRKPILLSNRKYSFAKNRDLHSGFKLINPFGFGNQLRGANSIPCEVSFTGTGTWWNIPSGSIFDVEMRGFGATATKTATDANQNHKVTTHVQFMGGAGVLWTSLFRDLGFLNWSGVWGSATSKMLHTACAWDGWLNINNARSTSINLGGSDSLLGWSTALIDAGSKQMDPNAFHIIMGNTQKTPVSGIYMTADNVKGIKITGSPTDGAIHFLNCRIEGRNAGAPSNQLVEIASGARVKFISCWLNFQRTGPFILNGGELVLMANDFLKANSWTVGRVTSSTPTAEFGNTSNWGARPTF